MKKQNGDMEKTHKEAALFAGILILAVIAGIVVMVLTSPRGAKAEATPAPTEEPAVTVTATPAPTPTSTPTPPITAIRLYAYGRELDAGGFTLYVGDKPVELTAEIEPAELNLPIGWTFSDQEAVSMNVSSDGKTCTITALKPAGRQDLSVVCNNLYTSIPVYLWEK